MPYTKSYPQLAEQSGPINGAELVALSGPDLSDVLKTVTVDEMAAYMATQTPVIGYDEANDWWYLSPDAPDDAPAFVFADRNGADPYYPFAFGSPINFDLEISGQKIPDFRMDSSRRPFMFVGPFIHCADNPVNIACRYYATASGDGLNDPAASEDPIATAGDALVQRTWSMALAATSDPSYPNGLRWELDVPPGGNSDDMGRNAEYRQYAIGAQTDTNRAGLAEETNVNVNETKQYSRRILHAGGGVTIFAPGQTTNGYSTPRLATLALDAGNSLPVTAWRQAANRSRGYDWYVDSAGELVLYTLPAGSPIKALQVIRDTGDINLSVDTVYVDRQNSRVLLTPSHAQIAGSSTARLQVHGAATPALALNRTNDGVIEQFYANGAASGNISQVGTTSTFNGTSDERLKTPVGPIDLGSVVDDIWLGLFDWNDGLRDMGAMAQQAHAILTAAGLPTVGISEGHGEPGDEDFRPWAMDYGRVFAVLAMIELKSVRARLTALEAA